MLYNKCRATPTSGVLNSQINAAAKRAITSYEDIPCHLKFTVTLEKQAIYHWDNFSSDKSRCFDYGDFVSIPEIVEDNIGVDVGIVPTLMDNIHIRDKVIAIIYGRTWIRFCDLKYLIVFNRLNKGPVSTTCPLANMSLFLQKLEHCSGENAEILHNHLKQSKLKIESFGVDTYSREAVTVVASYFTGH